MLKHCYYELWLISDLGNGIIIGQKPIETPKVNVSTMYISEDIASSYLKLCQKQGAWNKSAPL